MDYDELFPGRFLKSGEFKGKDVTLAIKSVRTEELPQDKGGMKVKGILAFERTPKELVLNRTNGECIKAMFGRNTDEWIGKRVTFWPAPFFDSFSGEQTTAIRVRGSPDIDADKKFDLRLPKRKPIPMVLKAIGKAAMPMASGRPRAVDAAAPPADDSDQLQVRGDDGAGESQVDDVGPCPAEKMPQENFVDLIAEICGMSMDDTAKALKTQMSKPTWIAFGAPSRDNQTTWWRKFSKGEIEGLKPLNPVPA